MRPLTDEQRARVEAHARIPAALAQEAARGDDGLFEALYDFAMASFLATARQFDPGRHPGGEAAFGVYCAHYVKRQMWCHYGRRARRVKAFGLDAASRREAAAPAAPCPLEAAEDARRLRVALGRLPWRQAKIVRSYYFAGDSLRGSGGARRSLSSALARLRSLLEE